MVSYAATLGAAGGVFFLGYTHHQLDPEIRAPVRSLVMLLLISMVIAGCARIAAAGASMSGDAGGLADAGLARMFLEAGEWRPDLIRLAGLGMMAVGLVARRPTWLALLGAAAAATSFAWSGHVHALGRSLPGFKEWLPNAALALHLLCAAYWLGGLGPLLLVVHRADMQRAAATVALFGRIAQIVVAALVSAGGILACFLLTGVHELWYGEYGRLLLGKVCLVAGLLSLAAINRWRLTPRLLANDAAALRALSLSIKAELAIAFAVLCATAALTSLAGPARLASSDSPSIGARGACSTIGLPNRTESFCCTSPKVSRPSRSAGSCWQA